MLASFLREGRKHESVRCFVHLPAIELHMCICCKTSYAIHASTASSIVAANREIHQVQHGTSVTSCVGYGALPQLAIPHTNAANSTDSSLSVCQCIDALSWMPTTQPCKQILLHVTILSAAGAGPFIMMLHHSAQAAQMPMRCVQ
jgi:hypothetical protein